MTSHTVLTADGEADIRWRDWQARGATADRRRAATMGRLTVLLSIALAVGLLVQLV